MPAWHREIPAPRDAGDRWAARAAALRRAAYASNRAALRAVAYEHPGSPWGTLIAVDMNSLRIKWKVPLGEYEELTARGIPVTGSQNFGGAISTAGGLIFVGATEDKRFRAFDQENGMVLWHYKLPAAGYATPSTYQIQGKQYIVIAAGGGSRNGSPPGDTYVAFSLPD